MLIDNTQTLEILKESIRVDPTTDQNSIINKFTTKPQGILIQDTYNNPFFPISEIQIDTYRMDLTKVFKRFREKYTKYNSIMLPWHFVVEMVDSRFYVFQTRPLDMKFPLTNSDLTDYSNFNTDTKDFINKNLFDISEGIHVCIIGDSNLDVYTKTMYEIIARFCINPFFRIYKLPEFRIYPLNLGKKFILDNITKFVHL